MTVSWHISTLVDSQAEKNMSSKSHRVDMVRLLIDVVTSYSDVGVLFRSVLVVLPSASFAVELEFSGWSFPHPLTRMWR